MSDLDRTGSGAVLRRKIEAGSKHKAGPETGARAWRVALSRAARDGLGLTVEARTIRDDRQSLSELLELPPERALCVVLEGPAEGLGLLVLSPEFLASVIEVQTMGDVSSQPPLPRRPTRTDAAMSMPLIDHALGLMETALATSPDLVWTAGFRYASFLEDARPLALLLDEIPYRVLRMEMDIAEGRRQGQVILALPAEGRGPRPQPVARPGTSSGIGDARWQDNLTEAVAGSETLLDAQIARIRIPLAQAMALEPGAILPLGAARLDGVALVGAEGTQLSLGKLGQHRGMRALRLTDPMAAPAPAPKPAPPAPVAQNEGGLAVRQVERDLPEPMARAV